MRWENLFDDLAGQLEHELDAEEVDVRGEEERLRIGRLTVRDRLVALHGATASAAAGAAAGAPAYSLRVQLADGGRLTVAPRSLGRDWLLGDLDDRESAAQCLLPFASIASLTLESHRVALSTKATGPLRLSDRLGLTFALRDLARRRQPVELHASFGSLHGTIDRVGRDHLDLAEHEPGSPRRQSEVSGIRMLPLTHLRWVQL